ncbi:MAG: PASTA domain-containing protein [Bacteroidaceae bacterium]|nr:PASTA domain-containing protein [Bacteroidaceae bacterium]
MRLSKYLNKIPGLFVGANCLGMLLLSAVLLAVGYYALQSYTHHGETVVVPDVRGKSVKEAERLLRDAGLGVEVSDTDYVAAKRADIILEQSLAAGMTVKPERVVHLTINAAHPLPVPLPDIADNSSTREAQALLASLGFKNVKVETMKGDKNWVYKVKAAGKEVAVGTPLSTDTPISIVVGNGQLVDAYNAETVNGEVTEYVTDTIPESELGKLRDGDIVLDNPEILVEEPIDGSDR